MDVSATIQLLGNMEAIDNIVGGIDNLITRLERLENAANSAFAAFSNVPDINIPNIPDVPTPQTPQEPQAPEPINWNPQSGIDIFSTTGVERYNQELAALDTQMQQIINSQTQIDSLADNMDLIPDNMVNDIESINQRIQTLGNAISTIQREGIDDIGANRANNQIERLRVQLNNALQSQRTLNGAIRNMDATTAQREYERLNRAIDDAERGIRDNINAQNQFNDEVKRGQSSADGLYKKIKGALGVYSLIKGVGKAIDLSDQMSQSTARLNMIVDDGGSVDALKTKIFNVAQNSRADYMDTMDLVGKLGVQAGNAFKNNDELLNFADQLNKKFVIAGTSQDGVRAATLQLTQALGSGVLRGEEFNSVFEQAPNIMQSIADYLGKDIGQLREMAADGQITADIVKNALFNSAEETNKAFNEMPMTFGQIWTSIKNQAIKAFEPILKKLSEIANSKGFQRLVKEVIKVVTKLGKILTNVFKIVCSIGEYFADKWDDISPILNRVEDALIALALALGIYKVGVMAATIATKIFSKALWANPATWVIAIIALIIWALLWLVDELGGLEATWVLVQMYWKLGCLGLDIAWEMAVASIVYAMDTLQIAMLWCKNQTLNNWDLIKLGLAVIAVKIENIVGDMKANVLTIIQDMVNGAIELINELISAINQIAETSIEPIAYVTFGATEALTNAAEQYQRETALQKMALETNDNKIAREKELDEAIGERDKKFLESAEKVKGLAKEMAQTYKDGWTEYAQIRVRNAADKLGAAAKEAELMTAANNLNISSGKNVDKVGKVDKVGGKVDVTSEDLKRMRDIYENDIVQEVYMSQITPQVSIQFGDVKETADVDEMLRVLKTKIKESINISPEGLHQGV